jgi:hypothetical protein
MGGYGGRDRGRIKRRTGRLRHEAYGLQGRLFEAILFVEKADLFFVVLGR